MASHFPFGLMTIQKCSLATWLRNDIPRHVLYSATGKGDTAQYTVPVTYNRNKWLYKLQEPSRDGCRQQPIRGQQGAASKSIGLGGLRNNESEEQPLAKAGKRKVWCNVNKMLL